LPVWPFFFAWDFWRQNFAPGKASTAQAHPNFTKYRQCGIGKRQFLRVLATIFEKNTFLG